MGPGMDIGVSLVETNDDVFGDAGGEVAASAEVRVDAKGRRLAECGCLERTLPPEAAQEPPFPATPGNVERLACWLKETYASSTFNTCEHQKLPMMKGAPPMRIHVREDVEPVAVHRPASIPAHWQAKVKSDIERNIKLGVLERVPANTLVTWCSRMHVVSKKNGDPWRVVDMRPVNFGQQAPDSSCGASL